MNRGDRPLHFRSHCSMFLAMDSEALSRPIRSPSYVILACLFTGAIVAANLIGTKVIPFFSIGGFQFTGSVGLFLFPLTFLITALFHRLERRLSSPALLGVSGIAGRVLD